MDSLTQVYDDTDHDVDEENANIGNAVLSSLGRYSRFGRTNELSLAYKVAYNFLVKDFTCVLLSNFRFEFRMSAFV